MILYMYIYIIGTCAHIYIYIHKYNDICICILKYNHSLYFQLKDHLFNIAQSQRD